MDPLIKQAVDRSFEEKDDLPDAAADNDDVEDTPRDIEHEQIYYLLADAYPDKFEDAEDAKETIHEVLDIDDEEKGVDVDEATEENDEFNPGNTPDNLDQHPYDEEEWQEDYDAEYSDDNAAKNTCEHTDHRGRPLEREECPWCDEEEE